MIEDVLEWKIRWVLVLGISFVLRRTSLGVKGLRNLVLVVDPLGCKPSSTTPTSNDGTGELTRYSEGKPGLDLLDQGGFKIIPFGYDL